MSVQLFVIDNSPTDMLRSELKDVIRQERITYIFNNKNLGYGAGHNVAIRQVLNKSTYHLVLNPDVYFEKGTVEKLIDFAERNSDVGLVTPKVIYPNGETQYVCKLLPTPQDLIFRRFLPTSFTTQRMERYELRMSGYDRQFEVPYVHGCCMFLRTAILQKTGIFDERFFMYPEDIDLTRRMHRISKTVFFPGAVVVHRHAKESYKSLKLFFIHFQNIIRYFNKWGWIYDDERTAVNQKILRQFKENGE